MGADVSRIAVGDESSISANTTKSARKKRTSGHDSTSGGPGKKRRDSRRKSSGRNERKSILDLSVDTASLTAFHEDIPNDLAPPERVQRLYKDALEYALRHCEVSNSDGSNAAMHELVKTTVLEWHGQVTDSGGWDNLCETSRIRPNPKNKEMEQMLMRYKAKLEELEREKSAWEEEFNASAAPKESAGAIEREDSWQPERQIVAGKTNSKVVDATDMALQLDVLEQFIRSSSKLAAAFEDNQVTTTGRIQAARFSNLDLGDDPKKLLLAVSHA
eukprot:m.94565 g.94565  ORF g.94565 m.94565 type:complete len:274 (+) comp16549_c0_seq2:59-880(+)